MEVNNLFKLLAISSSNERQARPDTLQKQRYFGHDIAVEDGEFLVKQNSHQELTPEQVVSLYLEQMNAAKQHLMSDYSAILSHLTMAYSRTFPGETPAPLSEVLNSFGNSLLQDNLFSRLDNTETQRVTQYLTENATHISSLRSQDMQMRTFPKNLTDWLSTQHIMVDAETMAAVHQASAQQVSVLREQSDLQRFQEISSSYNKDLEDSKQKIATAYDEMQRALKAEGIVDFTVQQVLSNRELKQPISQAQSGALHPQTDRINSWYESNSERVNEIANQKNRLDSFPDMSQWAKSRGYNHPWLHNS